MFYTCVIYIIAPIDENLVVSDRVLVSDGDKALWVVQLNIYKTRKLMHALCIVVCSFYLLWFYSFLSSKSSWRSLPWPNWTESVHRIHVTLTFWAESVLCFNFDLPKKIVLCFCVVVYIHSALSTISNHIKVGYEKTNHFFCKLFSY